MKRILLFFTIYLITTTATNAQIWKKIQKKLEKKVEQKIENKIEKETDKVIDSALYGKKKKDSVSNKIIRDDRLKSYGSASISHSTLYGMFSVNDLTKTKINKKGKEVSISGSWRSSDADVADGYFLKINNVDDINNLQNKSFKIPEEATLELNYNALVSGTYQYERGKEHAPQILKVSNGNVTVTFNKDNNIGLNFFGNVLLRNHKTATEMEHTVAATINGMVNTKEPEFTITKFVNTDNSSNNNKVVSDDDAQKIINTISPTVDIPSTFAFNKNIAVEVTNDRGESYPIEFLLGNYPDIYGISVATKEMQGQGKVIMVMTPKSSTAFMDVAGMKMKRTTSLDQIGAADISKNLPKDGDFEYKKTGNTKTILGYTCEEYKVDYSYTNESGSASFWVSKDFPVQNKALPMLGMSMNNPNFSGFVLELNSTHNGQNWTMKVTDMSDINTTINTNDFRSMGN